MNLIHTSLDDVDGRYRGLVDVASALASHSELTDVLRSLRGHLEPLIQFTFLAVCLPEGDSDTLVVRHLEPGELAAEFVLGMSHPLDGSYQGQAVRTRRPVYVAQVQPGDPFRANLAVEHAVESFCIVPLITPRRTLGTLDFGSLRPHAYAPEDIEFMSRVASLVAVAIENAMNLETVREQQAALQHERDQLDLLLDVTNAVVTQLDTRALFAAVAPALRRCCSADFAALTLFDPETRVLR